MEDQNLTPENNPITPGANPTPPETNQTTPVGNVPFYQPQAVQPAPQVPQSVDIHVDVPQVIEKVVYKQQRIHWFFRTLTIIALAAIWFLMLMENYGILKIYIWDFALNIIYPIFIIFSCIVIWSYRWLFGKIFGLIMFLAVVWWFFTINTYNSLNPSTQSKVGDFISYMSPGENNTWIKLSKINVNTLIWGYEIKGIKTDNLLEGKYKSDRKLSINSGVKINYDYINLSEDTNWNVLQNIYTTVNLWVNNKKTVDLYFKNLLGINNIDLSDINWFQTDIYGWIQDLTVTLWAKMFKGNQLDIQQVWWMITIYIPKKVWVKLSFKQLAWSLELTDFDIKDKNNFESRNISVSDNIVNININSWISKFKIIRK